MEEMLVIGRTIVEHGGKGKLILVDELVNIRETDEFGG